MARPTVAASALLRALRLGDTAELLLASRQRIQDAPLEHARAAAVVTQALDEARRALRSEASDAVRGALLQVARRDWTAAASLAQEINTLAALHPETVPWVADAVARAVQADRPLARMLAQVLPGCASRIAERGPRLRVITALADLCRRHPGLGIVVLPIVDEMLREGRPEGVAEFLEESLGLAGRGENAARSFLLRESRSGQEAWESRKEGLPLVSVARTLQLYAEATLGRPVAIRPLSDLPASIPVPDGTLALTDGRDVFLVPRIARWADDLANFRLYKVALAQQLGRIEFGTFLLEPLAVRGILEPPSHEPEEDAVVGPIARFLRMFSDDDLADRLFFLAEDLRVDACLRRERPGLGRDLEAVAAVERRSRPDPESLHGRDQVLEVFVRRLWYGEPMPPGEPLRRFREAASLVEALRHPAATVQDSAAATGILYGLFGGGSGPLRPPSPPQSSSKGAAPAVDEEGPGQPTGWSTGPSDGGGEDVPGEGGPGPEDAGSATPGARCAGVVDRVDEATRRELLDEAALIQHLLDSRGVSVGVEEIVAQLLSDRSLSEDAVVRLLLERHRAGAPLEGGGGVQGAVSFRYPEWDQGIGDFRPRWTTVWERRAAGDASAWVDNVLDEHALLLRRLRREFQLLRPRGWARQRRMEDGEEIDIDAFIAERSDHLAGLATDGRVHLRRRRSVRDVAVAFLVDQSASTREPAGPVGRSILDVEKDALILMGESLACLGDRFAIFGFSGRGRQLVTFDVYKDWHEPMDRAVRGRIGAMTWRMENRDGAAIRHATRRLLAVDARVRLLILLSDGKPLDCGCESYQGAHAVADTQRALREAREQRIHPFCITVDPQGADYLGALYGDVRYAVIDRVEDLPERLPRIYRRLTT